MAEPQTSDGLDYDFNIRRHGAANHDGIAPEG